MAHQDLRCLQIQLFSSVVVKELTHKGKNLLLQEQQYSVSLRIDLFLEGPLVLRKQRDSLIILFPFVKMVEMHREH